MRISFSDLSSSLSLILYRFLPRSSYAHYVGSAAPPIDAPVHSHLPPVHAVDVANAVPVPDYRPCPDYMANLYQDHEPAEDTETAPDFAAAAAPDSQAAASLSRQRAGMRLLAAYSQHQSAVLEAASDGYVVENHN